MLRKFPGCGAPDLFNIPVEVVRRSNIDCHMSVCTVLRWAWQFYCHGRLTWRRTLSSSPLQNGNVVMHKYPQRRGKHGKGWKSTQKHLPCIMPGKICSLNELYSRAYALIHFGNTKRQWIPEASCHMPQSQRVHFGWLSDRVSSQVHTSIRDVACVPQIDTSQQGRKREKGGRGRIIL